MRLRSVGLISFVLCISSLSFVSSDSDSISPSETVNPDYGLEFFTFTQLDIRGEPVHFEQFKGKATLLVNTASQCSHTEPQLKSLKRLHDILSHGQKFNVVAYPCNEFGEQEPWEAVEIEEYYRGHFKIEFIILEKGTVTDESPLWKWIRANSVAPTWNFQKYLIDGQGRILKNWPADVTIESIFDEVQSLVDSIPAASGTSAEAAVESNENVISSNDNSENVDKLPTNSNKEEL